MTFLNPLYLWGLCALAIPIAIHLWSRKKVQTIKVGSTQFITETKSKQSNSIQFNEWWLLFMRSLIICTLVTILAEPQTTKKVTKQKVAYVFEPSLLATPDGIARFDQIPKEGRRLLTKGFPKWKLDEEIKGSDEVPNYWQLAQELDQVAADSVVVFVHAFAKALKGKRPTTSSTINWVLVTPENIKEEPFAARKIDNGAEVLIARGDDNSLTFDRKVMDESAFTYSKNKDSISISDKGNEAMLYLKGENPITIGVLYDKKYEDQWVYLEAAFRAIESYTQQSLVLSVNKQGTDLTLQDNDRVVWLSDQDFSQIEKPALLLQHDILATGVLVTGNVHNQTFLTQKLTPEVIQEEQFVALLLEWLELDSDLEDALDRLDQRVVSQEELTINYTEKEDIETIVATADLSWVLWIVLLILLVGERILAKIRKQ